MKYSTVVFVALLVVGLALTDREICQQSLNGFFEQNKLPDPVTIMDCASDSTATKIVEFVGKSLNKAARGSATDLVTLIYDIDVFIESLPADEVSCVRTNPEGVALQPLYNIDPNDFAATEKKLAIYVTLHYFQVHKWLVECDDLWNAAKYYDTGYRGAAYIHQILGSTIDKILERARKLRNAAKGLIDTIK